MIRFAAPAALRISAGADVVTCVERFDVTPDAQAAATGIALRHIEHAWADSPGFIAATVLRGREHGGIACYAQWTAAGPPHEVPARWSLRTPLRDCEPLESRTFRVAFTQRADTADAPVDLVPDHTPLAHFGLFAVDRADQDRMIDLARRYAPNSFATPGLAAINFHTSLDGTRVINFGLWSSLSSFETLHQQKGFKEGSPYWSGVARFQPEFFDVVAVLRATRDRH